MRSDASAQRVNVFHRPIGSGFEPSDAWFRRIRRIWKGNARLWRGICANGQISEALREPLQSHALTQQVCVGEPQVSHSTLKFDVERILGLLRNVEFSLLLLSVNLQRLCQTATTANSGE